LESNPIEPPQQGNGNSNYQKTESVEKTEG